MQNSNRISAQLAGHKELICSGLEFFRAVKNQVRAEFNCYLTECHVTILNLLSVSIALFTLLKITIRDHSYNM